MYFMDKKFLEVSVGKVDKVMIRDLLSLVFIGATCAIESRDHTFKMADTIRMSRKI